MGKKEMVSVVSQGIVCPCKHMQQLGFSISSNIIVKKLKDVFVFFFLVPLIIRYFQMHIVMQNVKYESFSQAAGRCDGLAVIAVLLGQDYVS